MKNAKLFLTSQLTNIRRTFGSRNQPSDLSPVFEFHLEQLEPRVMLAADLGELIFQADFEDVAVGPRQFGFFAEVSGLTATQSPVEVQNNPDSVGPASQGMNHLELDGVNGVQVELNSSSSAPLTLVFDYSARPAVSGDQNAIEVWWNGMLVNTIVDDGSRNKSTNFRNVSFELGTTNSNTSLLEFRSNSPDDVIGLGGLIDNVRVYLELGPLSLANIEDQVLATNEQLNLTARLSGDEIVEGLTYSILSGPEGILINSETGEIEWYASQANINASDAANDRVVQGEAGLLFQSGFEDVVISPGGYGFVGQVSGFAATGAPVEIQNNYPSVGAPSEGQNNLELDGVNGIFRNIETIGLDEFELVVDYSPRPGVDAASNAIEIWWDGQLIGTLSEDGSRKRRTEFETYRFSLPTHSSDLTRLEFRSIDPTDTIGLGGLLDNIKVYRTPVTQVEGEDGKYEVVVQVADPAGRTDRESFTICVEDSVENHAPELESIPDQSTNEGATLEYQVNATDFENQVLTYSLSPGAHDGASINPSTGVFKFETSEAEGPGEYEFEVNVSDGELTTQATFRVTVNEVNLAPELIVPSEVAGGAMTLDLRSTLSLDFDATDSDTPQNQLLFSMEEYVAGAQIDPDTGVFTFFPTSAMVGQSFDFNIIVRDNGFPVLSDSHRFSIEVASCPFDDALTNWTVQESGGSDGQIGHVDAADCQAVITEGDSFFVSLATSFIVQQNKAIQFSYSDLIFDTTDDAFINDAFEVALLGSNGQSLIDTFANGRDAFFNISEGLSAATGDGVDVDGETITVGLNGLAVGTEATLLFRLVNDDSDTTTSVKITDFAIVDSFAEAVRRNAVDLGRNATETPVASATTPIRDSFDNTQNLPVVVSGGDFFVAPEVTEPVPLTPNVEWFVDAFAVRPESDQVMMTPAVFDLNNDSYPDIVFSTFAGNEYLTNGTLRAIDGRDGSPIWTLDDDRFEVTAAAHVAIGDIDQDGLPEVIARHESGGYMAVENDGTVKWIGLNFDLPDGCRFGDCDRFQSFGGASLADLDHDGIPEIIVGSTVMDADGAILWTGDAGWSNGLSAVADLDNDGSPEIVTATTAYRANGEIYWNIPVVQDPDTGFNLRAGYPALGNFDSDSFPEIVSKFSGKIFLREHDGSLIWESEIPGGGGGAPTIADFDGDGKPEIGVAGASNYVVFEHDGQIKWQQATVDASSAATGSSVFDFDSDGRAEVIYGDEFFLRIYDGTTGEELYKLAKGSGTTFELPVVVDVDGDGKAEIVAVANSYVNGNENGIYVIGDDANWSTTRPIWNQHTYHITNINDDGSIPAYELNSWEIYNNYRRNQQPTGRLLGEPLIVARAPRAVLPAGGQVMLSGEATAQGVQTNGQLNRIVTVTVNGRPVDQLDATGKFFATVELLPGVNEYLFEATDIAGQTTQASLAVVGSQTESEINFNQFADITQSIEGVYARTSFDELNTALFVDLVAANKGTFPANGPLLVGVNNISHPSVSLLGFDGFTPDGMPYYDFTKYLTDDSLDSGSQSESATIGFFNPLVVQFDYDLVFLAQVNDPPEITSLPVIEAYYDEGYTYDVEAIDANHDELTYALTITSPGMTIDAATGFISWSPTINDYGLHDIAIEVTDGRGGKATQRYTLNVSEAPPNRPPIIVSTPVTTATLPIFETFPVDQMVLNGDAELAQSQDGEVIRLTPSVRGQAGSAFSQTLRNANDFSAAFNFRITDSAGPSGLGGNPQGADGLAFIIQSVSNTVGGSGGGLGYGGIDQSVAVEFDTFQNPNVSETFWDPSSNHVGINVNGIAQHNNEFVVTIDEPFDNGELWYAWVDYDGFDLEVRLSQENVRPNDPTLSRTLDIPTIIASQKAYFGFASGTGDTWSNHDLVEWRFNDEFSPFDQPPIAEPVELSNWGVVQFETSGVESSWEISEDGLSVEQVINADASIFLSDFILDTQQIDGTWRKNIIEDDDMMGFVFGYQDPSHFYLFDWKQSTQDVGVNEDGIFFGEALVGMSVKRFDASRVLTAADLWSTEPQDDQVELLFHNDLSYEPEVDYRFTLNYRPGSIEIIIRQGDVVVETIQLNDGAFVKGQFGFYNNSQSNILYSGFQTTVIAPTAYQYDVQAIDADDDQLTYALSQAPGDMTINPQTGMIQWAPTTAHQPGELTVLVDELADANGVAVVGNTLYFSQIVDGGSIFSLDISDPDASVQTVATGLFVTELTANGDELFIATNSEIKRLDLTTPNATPTTYLAGLDYPLGMTFDGDEMYFSEYVGGTISKVDTSFETPVVETVLAGLAGPHGLAKIENDLYFIQWSPGDEFGTLSKVSLTGVSPIPVLVLDKLSSPNDILLHNGLLYITEGGTRKIARVDVSAATPVVTRLSVGNANPNRIATDGEDFFISSYLGFNVDGQILRYSENLFDRFSEFGVTVEVTDGKGGVAEQSFVVCVHEDLTTEIRQVITSFEGAFANRLVNDAPTITSVPRINAIQGEQYLYAAVASDLNNDAIKWNLDSAPVGMTIDVDTGEIQWTPTGEQLGDYLVVLSAYDSMGASATQRFQVHVGCNNLPPAIVSIPPTAALTQRDYVYSVRARDIEGDTLTWSLESAPEGMTINAESGFIRWQPALGQIGPQEVIVNVSDGTSTAKQTYTVVVSSADELIDPNDPAKGTKGNRAPLIISTPQFGATVDALYQYQIEAIDLDGHNITFALVGNVRDGMSVDENGRLTWTPTSVDSGDVAVNVQAIDEFGAIASQGFILKVASNSAPTIESTPPPTVVEGRTYRYTINAIDADGDELEYELVEGPDGMMIDAQIGYITWLTFEHPVTAGTMHDVSIKVTDAFGNETLQSWQIEVIEDTVAPTVSITVISPSGVFFGQAAEFNIGQPYTVQVLARDNARIIRKELTLDGVDIPLDSRGIAVITPTQSGLFELVGTATDSAGLMGTAATTVNLLNEAPEIISQPPSFAAANEDFVYQVIASDAEEHAVTYSITDGPTGATIDGLSGEFTIAAADFAPGNYGLTVRATDEFGAFSQQSINFDAIDLSINHAPIFLTQPPTKIPAGLFYFYLPQTLDYNGDTVTYKLIEGGAEFKEETGQVRLRVPFTPGDLEFAIQADDGNGGITTQEFTVAVTPANRAPVFISQPTVRVKAGELYAYAPVISDPNGDDFTLYNREGPRERKPGDYFSSWSIDIGDDNVIRWQTDLDDVGSYTVTLGAQDEWGEWGYQSFTLDVVEDLTSPLVEVVATPNPAEVGDRINVQVLAFDDGTIESRSLTFEGQTIELDAEGRGSFTTTATGHFELVAVATDDEGNSTERTVPLQVRDLSDMQAPVVSIASPVRDSVVTSFTDIVGSVVDQNLLYYSLSYAPLSGGSFVEFYRSDQTVDNDVLGVFDPTTLANDSYRIRAFAKDVNNQTSIDETVVEVMGELKLGNFTLSFSDMTIPIGGIPIIVGRTYDSLNANQQGEFGYGWRLEFRDVDLRTSVAPSGQEDLGFYRPFKDGSRVYLTLPGGKREGFTFEVERAGGLRGALGMHLGTFKPDAGVKTQLTVPKFELAFDSEANVYTWGSNQAYNPANSIFGGKYYATTEAGVLFEIDGDSGDLERVIDTNANVITYTDEAIVSSSGQRVDFIRDERGRIIQAIDPEGNAILYAYDDQGDLISVTDREGNVTRFNYDAPRPHYLSEIIDPLGRTGIRTEYDETGKLVRMFDVNGNMTQLIHDPDNFVEQIVDPLGNTTTYEYDERGNVLREIDALGGVTTTTYDIENNELTITDPLGNTAEMTYSETGDLLTRTDALGNETTKTYDRIQPKISLGGFSFGGFVKPFSIETSTTDAAGNVSSMGYDSQGNLTSMTNAAGEVNTFEFDSSGAPTSVSRAGTTPQTFEYDAAGNLIESVDAFGNKTLVTYDGNGEIRTETIAQTLTDGSVVTTMTESEYDMEGRIRFVRYFEDGVMLTENESRYNEVGQRVEQIDTLGRSTTYVYDERGLLVETIYPDLTPDDDSDNPRTRTEYDVLGQSTARIDELGRQTEYVYDALGRLVSTIFPDATPDDPTDNPRTETIYDLAGRMIAQIDELGNRTETIYDAAGRAIFTVLPDDTPDDATDNPRFETVYDAAGRAIEQIDPLGNVTKFAYENGRPVRTIFADGTTSENIYNDIGIVVASIDQNGIRTDYEYNAQGQLLAVISAEVVNPVTSLNERPRTEYEYDSRGNLLVQRDALGRETSYVYDARGRQINSMLPMGQIASSTYDVIGRLSATTDFNGDTTTYVYDERDRLTSREFADGSSVDMTYTVNGFVETVADARGVTRYTYDERNRLVLQVNPDSTSLAYTYDVAGNRTSITVPSGKTSYTYDARNRIQTVTDPDGDVTTYVYNAMNLVSTLLPNGTTETRVYDSRNRLTFLENSGPNGVINSFSYSLDAAGNRTGVLEGDGRRVDYVYDDLYRLTSETITDAVNGNQVIGYVYDIVGNRLERNDSVEGITTYAYDANDRLLSEAIAGGITEYTYDANGNTLTKSVDGVLATTHFWDLENRLVASDTDGDGTIDVENVYDANGVRVSQTVDGVETKYLVDAARQFPQVVEEYTDGGVIKVSYVYGRDLISQNRPAETGKSIYHIDGLGSTRALTDSVGAVTDRYIYDAFGRTLVQVGTTGNIYLFAGEQRDFATGLDYLRARYLNSATGRFVSRDRASSRPNQPLTANRYSYVENNAVNLVDPSGLSSIGELSTAQAIIGSLVASQGFLASAFLLESALSNDIVESKFLTLSVSTSRFHGTLYAAKTPPLPRYPEGIIQVGVMIGLGATAAPTSIGLEFSSGTTYSPGLFFDNKTVARAAFMPIFVIASVGISIGPLGVGFGGGFIGFSAADLSGNSFSASLDDLDGNASVFAGVSFGVNASDCRDEPFICSLAEIDLGGPSNEDLIEFIVSLFIG